MQVQIPDPRQIPQSEMPFHFVFSNQSTSGIAFLINWFTKANFDHVMQAIDAGKFVTQDFGGYHIVPMDQYLKKGGTLKFVKIVNATEIFNIAFRNTILNDLSKPWFTKIYDAGNILGRIIGIKQISIPGTHDCSERSLSTVKRCSHHLPDHDALVINSLPNWASPDDIDQCVKNNPDIFEIYGQWIADEGIIV